MICVTLFKPNLNKIIESEGDKMDKKTEKIIIVVVVLLVLLGISTAILYKKYEPHVVLNDSLVFEYGEKISLKDFNEYALKSISKQSKIDNLVLKTDQVGDFKGSLDVKTKLREKKLQFSYTVADSQAPTITGIKDLEVVANESIKFDHLKAHDPVDGEVEVVIQGLDQLDLSEANTYTLTAVAVDKNKNKTEEKFKVTVINEETEPNENNTHTSQGTHNSPGNETTNSSGGSNHTSNVGSVIGNPQSELVLVNRKQRLPYDYVPPLKEMPTDYVVGNDTGYYATPNTVAAFIKMVDALYEETGLWLWNTSSYRGADFQEELYTNYVNQHGQAEADRMSAKPGHSEHQTGLVIDVVTPGGSMWTFAETQQSAWVNKNAHRFGFIVRYPEGKEHITGYMPEAWHLRYIGVDAATKVYQSGLTFDEWLD